MRRIILFVAFSIFFLFLSYFLTLSSYAQSSGQCTVNITPNSVDPFYKGNVTITAVNCKLPTTAPYTIIFCPKNKPLIIGNSFNSNECTVDRKKPNSDEKTITAELNILQSTIGQRNPGVWNVTLCTQTIASDCDEVQNIKAQGSMFVGAIPTPTPPSDLPKIDALAQARCTFERGETVTLKATNIRPNTSYHWWWNGNLRTNFAGTSGASDTELIFTIPGSETTKIGIRNVCIDKLGSRVTGQEQQCISLNFLSQTPQGDTSCKAINSGTEYFMLNKDDSVPLLYCAEGETENGTIIKKKDYTMQEWEEKSKTIEKCLVISTAIGDISTNPAEFIQRIFSLVLGLAGGIALILIILAGYRFMASQGDPEKVVEARQQLIAAIVGLLFIIFSFVILQVIGVDILKIPGFE